MAKFRGNSFVLLLSGIILLSSCNLLNGNSGSHTVSVSVKGSSGSKAVSAEPKVLQINSMIDETYYKDSLKEANRGNLLQNITPEQFVLDLDYLKLYTNNNGNYKTCELVKFITNPYGTIIPRHINILHAKGFIRNVDVNGSIWSGITLKFLPNTGRSDWIPYQSVVCLRLGSEYSGIVLPGEETRFQYGGSRDLHYFSVSTLTPFVGRFAEYLTIGSDIQQAGIQNPSGSLPANGQTWTLPGGDVSSDSTAIFLPGPSIDFTGYVQPEVFLSWDLNNLVQIYDAGTPSDYSDDVVTFNLANPFPVSLKIQEQSTPAAAAGDAVAPGQVLMADIAASHGWSTLVWMNPSDDDFDHVEIIRKASSAPSNISDGEKVYSNFEPNYVDTTGISGKNYFYAIYTVDISGNRSAPVVLNGICP